jgi:hypothetical protein
MPLRYRPYYPRRYGANYQQDDGVARGLKIGSEIGGSFQKLAEAIKGQQAKAAQDKVANQLINQNWQVPRAQWVGGKAPAAGTNLAGSAPATGGVDQLNMLIKEAQVRQALQGNQAKLDLARTVAQNRAGGGNSVWTRGRGGGTNTAVTRNAQVNPNAAKPQKYVPGSSDLNSVSSDDIDKIRADFDTGAGRGKGSLDKLQPYLRHIVKKPDGTYVFDVQHTNNKEN